MDSEPNFQSLKRSYEVSLIIYEEKYRRLILIPGATQQLTTPSSEVPESIYSHGLLGTACSCHELLRMNSLDGFIFSNSWLRHWIEGSPARELEDET